VFLFLDAFGQRQTEGSAMSTAPVLRVRKGGESMNPSNVNSKLAEAIEPRWYQTNISLSQPPTMGANRPVREYVTNVSWRVNQ
jgi:hypothetical protein